MIELEAGKCSDLFSLGLSKILWKIMPENFNFFHNE